MKKINIVLITIACLTFANCKNENDKYPIDKRYWDTMDYSDVIFQLKYSIEPDEKLPTFNDPETRLIVEKLTDQQNYKIVLDDNELGLKHRNKVASDFFSRWKDMNSIYRATDRKDHYLYSIEMMKVYHFGLGLQLKYFKLANDEILVSADDPNSNRVKNDINSNIRTLISNYLNYLDEINDEKSFSEEGKNLLSKGIDKYFTELIELYPNANFSSMKNKIILMEKKSESKKIKESLNKIKQLIESKKKKE